MEFRVVGPLEVECDGTLVAAGSPRQRCLLALLLLRRDEVVDVDRLADQLWNEAPPRTARHSLQSHVHRLRVALGDGGSRLQTYATGYRLACAADEVDSQRFTDLAGRGREALADEAFELAVGAFDAALGLWRGAPLADLPDLAAFVPERARLEGLRLQIVEDRFEALLGLGRDGLADELEAMVAEHPLRERLWRLLLVALYRSGRQAAALEAFQRARGLLNDELGVEPGPELARLEQQILRHDPALGPTDAASSLMPIDLPVRRTTFIGRRRELDEVRGLLRTHQLVTIVGAPGSGKTRLAIQAASALGEDFPHGTRFVSLADLDDAQTVPNTIAAALGVTAADRPTIAALAGYLRTKRLLIVIDNVEHVRTGAIAFTALLDAAAGVRILATSRAPLRLSGEQVYPLDPLPLPLPPAEAAAATPSDLDVDSVRLFVDRAHAVTRRFAVTANNAADVTAVVQRTGGLPLAIELAAARLRQFTIAELRRQFDPALPMLAAGPMDAPVRHRAMRDAIAWSIDLLAEGDRALFRRLGVFRGGFTIDAAEAVTSTPPVGNVVAGIARLVDAALLEPPGDGDAGRYTMLEPIRECAIEHLDATSEAIEVSDRHAVYYAAFATRDDPDLINTGTRQWLDRFDGEHGNFQAALRRLEARGDLEGCLTLATRLSRVWQLRGRVPEGRQTLERLIAAPAAGPQPHARGRALVALAALCYWMGDPNAAVAHYKAALSTLDPGSDFDAYGEALLWLIVLLSLYRSDIDEAEGRLQSLKQLFETRPSARIPDMAMPAATGMVRFGRGDIDGARKAWEDALTTAPRRGLHWGHGQLLRMLAGIDLVEGRHTQARDRLVDCLVIMWDIGDLVSVALDLELLGLAEVLTGRPAQGVTFAGAADRLQEHVGGIPARPAYFDAVPDVRHVAAQSLSGQLLERAWARGRTLTAAAAVTAARDRESHTSGAAATG